VERAAQVDVDEILCRLEEGDGELPSPPLVALSVVQLSDDPNAGMADFAEVIAGDPALAVRMLRLANSSLFGMAVEVSTLEQATRVLGLNTVKLLALSFSVLGKVGGPHDDHAEDGRGAFPYREYWERSVSVAAAARQLGRAIAPSLEGDAFLHGLLAHVGRLLLQRAIPRRYASALERGAGWPDSDTEEELLGFDHAAAAGAILRSWGMPASLHEALGGWTHPERLPEDVAPRTRQLALLVQLADLAVQVIRDREKGAALTTLHQRAMALGLTDDDVDVQLLTLESRIVELAGLLEIEAMAPRDHYEMLVRARRQVFEVGLQVATDARRMERRASHLELENHRLASRANRDALTGLGNRSCFEEVLRKEAEARLSAPLPNALGLLMIDVDHFKDINDKHGHQAGDEVLRVIGKALRALCRETDLPARFGGDEFVVIAPSTDPQGLLVFAERIREAVGKLPVSVGTSPRRVCVSIGGACISDVSSLTDGERLVGAADRALYRAKEQGRDRCWIGQVEI